MSQPLGTRKRTPVPFIKAGAIVFFVASLSAAGYFYTHPREMETMKQQYFKVYNRFEQMGSPANKDNISQARQPRVVKDPIIGETPQDQQQNNESSRGTLDRPTESEPLRLESKLTAAPSTVTCIEDKAIQEQGFITQDQAAELIAQIDSLEREREELASQKNKLIEEHALLKTSIAELKENIQFISSSNEQHDVITKNLESKVAILAQELETKEYELIECQNTVQDTNKDLISTKSVLRTLEESHKTALDANKLKLMEMYDALFDKKSAELEESLNKIHAASLLQAVQNEKLNILCELENAGKKMSLLETTMDNWSQYVSRIGKVKRLSLQLAVIEENLRNNGALNIDRELLIEAVQEDPLLVQAIESIPLSLFTDGTKNKAKSFVMLCSEFNAMKCDIRTSTLLPETGASSFSEYLYAKMINFVTFNTGLALNESTHPTPDMYAFRRTDTILANTESLLFGQDLDGAARELNQLSGYAKLTALPWLRAARKHLLVQQALKIIQLQIALDTISQLDYI